MDRKVRFIDDNNCKCIVRVKSKKLGLVGFFRYSGVRGSEFVPKPQADIFTERDKLKSLRFSLLDKYDYEYEFIIEDVK